MGDVIVGIDLGTTNSLVGAVVEGRAELFSDASGSALLPSVVGTGPGGEIYVGRAAKNRRVLDPEGTVTSIKRRMGTDARVRVGGKELDPSQVSALILGALLDRAAGALGSRPARAVITVPAWFDDAQRQATRDAGKLAGLSVERLVNEPTAAALTYQAGSEELCLVYDLGGGTFDVSIVERDEGLLEVRSSRGDTRLGGDDVDQALVRVVLARLGAGRERVERDPRAMTRLLEAVECAKVALSDRETVRLFDPFLAGEGADAAHLDLELRREDVDAAAKPFVDRTLACIDAALRDARSRPADLDRVLLVGGASRMPIVRSAVTAHLGRPAQVDLDADRAVALGAALLAGRMAGFDVSEVLVDITPHTLAVGVHDPTAFAHDEDDDAALVTSAVIPRGTVIPVERTRTVYTIVDDQPAARLPIVQGERPRAADNTRLGEVLVEPLPPSPAGSPVEVAFRLDLSGVLHVSARHTPSGSSASVVIVDSPYGLTARRRDAAEGDLAALRERAAPPERLAQADVSLANAMLGRARRAMERAGADEESLGPVREAAAALASALTADAAQVPELTDRLSDALLDIS